MSPLAIAIALGTFLLGIAVGYGFREAITIALTGHTRGMPPTKWSPASLFARLLDFLTHYSRRLGVVLVVLALAANGFVGFLQIANGRSDAARAACNTRYNELDGIARDQRADFAKAQTTAELVWLMQLHEGVRTGELSRGGLLRSIEAYERALRATQVSRVLSPYPEPDMCSPPPDKLPELPAVPPSPLAPKK